MHMEPNKPNDEPTNGAAPPGSGAKQQAASASAAGGATAARGAAPAKTAAPSAPTIKPTNKVPTPDTAASAKPVAANGTGRSPKTAKVPTPDTDPAAQQETPRPYFFPEGMQSGDLPLGVQCAIEELVNPCMEELVIAEKDPLVKAIAGPLPFEKTTQILLQRKLTDKMLSDDPDPDEIERLVDLIDRSAKRVHYIEDKLLRMRRQQGLLR